MKNTWLLVTFTLLIAGCGQQGAEQSPSQSAAAPAETAQEFVARANKEAAELGREQGAAEWVRSTYITGDTAILAAANAERYAKWHGEMVSSG